MRERDRERELNSGDGNERHFGTVSFLRSLLPDINLHVGSRCSLLSLDSLHVLSGRDDEVQEGERFWLPSRACYLGFIMCMGMHSLYLLSRQARW